MISTTRKKLLILIVIAPIVAYVIYIAVLFTLIHFSISIGQTLAPGLSKEKFLAVKPGMNIENVISNIGYPIYEHRNILHGTYDGKVNEQYTVYVYAEPGFIGGLEVNVIIKNGVVSGTAVEYWDIGVYRCEESGLCDYWSDGMSVHIDELDLDHWWSRRGTNIGG